MFTLRPIRLDDLDDFVTLVGRADHGLTSLPKDRDLLRRRVERSVASMGERPLPRSQSSYLFVLEDSERGGLAGCCGCYGQVGGDVPYFAYELDTLEVGRDIGMPRAVRVLRVIEERRGPAMLGSLLLDPGFRGRGVGRFLSLTRMLFLADQPLRFEPEVLAELRGWLDDSGGSPFWDALGRHFFRMPLPEADLHTHIVDGFVHHLLPRQPVFVDMLPPEAQRVISAIHPKTAPAMDILKDEGFVLTPWLDPFEAGPIVRAQVEDLRTVRTSRVAEVVAVDDLAHGGPLKMVSNREREHLLDYRVALAAVVEDHGPGQDGAARPRVRLSRQVADALRVKRGDRVRVGDIATSRRAPVTADAAEEC